MNHLWSPTSRVLPKACNRTLIQNHGGAAKYNENIWKLENIILKIDIVPVHANLAIITMWFSLSNCQIVKISIENSILSNFALWKESKSDLQFPSYSHLKLNKIVSPSMSPRDKIIFLWWMVQADSNVIKKRRFCWLHPPRENYFISLWQISNEKELAPPPETYFVSWWRRKKIVPTPPRENYFVSTDNPLSNRVATAICCRVLPELQNDFSVRYSDA